MGEARGLPGSVPCRLQAIDVTKRYGRRQVLSGVHLTLGAGQVAAVVGENGSGKSTFLKICAGLVRPDRGQVVVSGSIGYCPQDAGLLDFLRPDEHFVLFGAGRALSRPVARRHGRQAVANLGWAEMDRRLVRDLSGGTRQKLNVALALVGDPDILLLDEPYQGFDRGSYLDFWQCVWRWRDAGMAVVVVTHLLHQLDRVDVVLDLGADAQTGASA